MTPAQSQSASALTLVNISSMVSREQNGARLTAMEWRLVQYLDGHAGRAVFDWELKDFLYQGICSEPLVRVHILNIRRKLGRSFIELCETGGYRLSSQRSAMLARVCTRCGKPVVQYEEEFVCYGCPSTQFADLDVGRASGPGERSGAAWTEEERAYAVAHAEDMTFEEIGAQLQRSESAVRGLYAQMGLTKRYVASVRRRAR